MAMKKFDVSFHLYDEGNRLAFKETLTVEAESQRYWDLGPAIYSAVNAKEHLYPNLNILYVYEHKYGDMSPYDQGAHTARHGPGGMMENPYVQGHIQQPAADQWHNGYTETLDKIQAAKKST